MTTAASAFGEISAILSSTSMPSLDPRLTVRTLKQSYDIGTKRKQLWMRLKNPWDTLMRSLTDFLKSMESWMQKVIASLQPFVQKLSERLTELGLLKSSETKSPPVTRIS